jgi:VWFA-related protein
VLTDTSFKVYGKASKNGVELAQALEDTDIGLREINRSQGFYGASDRLTISVKALSELLQAESKKPGRKLILWVSPGWPLLSGPEIDLDDKQREEAYRSVVAASDEMRNGNITLYSVNSWGATEDLIHESYYQSFLSGLKKPGDAQLGDLALQVMATQSGGLALNSSDVVGEIKQCVSDLDHYYRLTFEPAPGDKPNQYHDLKVTVAANGLIARTRQGYYSQPYGNHAP